MNESGKHIISSEGMTSAGEEAGELSTRNAKVVRLLKQLKELRDAGVLTEEEFQDKKEELLSELRVRMECMFYVRHSGYYGCAISPDGNYIAIKDTIGTIGNASEGQPPNVFIYDTNGSLVVSLNSMDGGETGVAFWPDSTHVIVSGCGQPPNWNEDGVKQWLVHPNASNEEWRHVFGDSPLTDIKVNIIGASPGGRFVLGESKNYDQQRGGWILDTHTREAKHLPLLQYEDRVVFSRDERFTGVARGLGLARSSLGAVIDNVQGEVIWSEKKQQVLVFSLDGRYFVTSEESPYPHHLVFWDVDTLERTEELELKRYGPEYGFYAAAFSNDGDRLAIATAFEKQVLILDVSTFDLLDRIPLFGKSESHVLAMEYSRRGELIIIENDFFLQSRDVHISVWR